MERYRVAPGQRVSLRDWDPDDTSAFEGDKEQAKAEVDRLNERLEALQELLFVDGRHGVLIVLQGMDTSGKDGVIRTVFDGVNPQGVKVASFKVPTPVELAHDYLWRVHARTPGRGEMTIFNRSHYEDVLVVRVHELVPRDIWSRRYEHLNAFERLLADEGTTVLKFFLHISKAEQQQRLAERRDEPTKRWKFKRGDLAERARWDDYQRAYEDVLAKTSTATAPWYIVPANRNWYRNLVILRVLVTALESLDLRYPPPEPGLDGIEIV